MSAELVLKAINDSAAAMRKKSDEQAAVIAALETKSREGSARLLELEQYVASVKGAPVGRRPVSSQSQALALLAKDARFSDIAEQRGRITLKAAQPVLIKALLTSLQGGADTSPATGYDVAAVRDPNLYFEPPRVPTLLDAMEVLPMTSGNTHEFVQIIDGDSSPGNADSGADYQLNEGDTKAEADVSFELQTVAPATIAVWQVISRQLLADVPQLLTMLGIFFKSRVRSKLEREIIAGTGGKGRILGLRQLATPYVATGAAPDRIGEALASMEGVGFMQPFILMHPAQWNDIRTHRTNEGAYIASSWSMPAPAAIWGAPVIRNSALPVGAALIIDRTAARYIDRQQTTVEISTEDSDNFRRNLATILCETRGTVEVMLPAGVLSVVLDSSP